MALVAPAVVDIWNIAFVSLARSKVDAVDSAASHAVVTAAVWPLFRQQFISDHEWRGCVRVETLEADATAPQDTEWAYRFDLEELTDAIRVLRIDGYQLEESQDKWRIMAEGDPPGRWLLSDSEEVKVEYLFDVTDAAEDDDGPLLGKLLGPHGSYGMAMELAAFLAPMLGVGPAEAGQFKVMAQQALTKAKAINSMEGSPKKFISGDTDLVMVRM